MARTKADTEVRTPAQQLAHGALEEERQKFPELCAAYIAAWEAEIAATIARERAEHAVAARIEEAGNKPREVGKHPITGEPMYATAGSRKMCAHATRQLLPFVPQTVATGDID